MERSILDLLLAQIGDPSSEERLECVELQVSLDQASPRERSTDLDDLDAHKHLLDRIDARVPGLRPSSVELVDHPSEDEAERHKSRDERNPDERRDTQEVIHERNADRNCSVSSDPTQASML